jgi:Ras-related protein Rab-1A
MWDTAGQERFKTITSSYYKGVHGIIVVYDVTDRESFDGVHEWMEQIEKSCTTNVARILVGNKTDLQDQRVVSTEEGQELADHYCIRFIETSAKDSTNVEKAVEIISRETLALALAFKPST